MKKPLAAIVMLVVLCLCAPMSHAQKLLATNLPGEPALAVSMTDLNQTYSTWSQTSTYAAIKNLMDMPFVKDSEELQEVLLRQEEVRVELGFPVTAESITQIVGGVTLGVYAPPSQNAPTDTLLPAEPEIVVVLEIKDAAKFASILKYVEGKLAEQAENSGGQLKKEAVGGREITMAADPGMMEPKFAFGMVADTTFAVGTVNKVKEMVAFLKNGGEGLAQSKDFKASAGPLASQAVDAILYLDQQKFNAMNPAFGGGNPFAGVPLIEESQKIKIAMAMRVMKDRIEVDMNQPFHNIQGTPLLSMIRKYPPSQITASKYVPQGTMLAGWGNSFDGELTYEVMDGVYKSLAPMMGGGQGTASLGDLLAPYEMQIGFTVKDDLCGGHGPELFFNWANLEGTVADVIIGLQVNDATKAEKVVNGLTKWINDFGKMMAGAQMGGQAPADVPDIVAASEYKGVKIHQLSHPMLLMQGYQPSICTNGEFLIISSTVGSLKAALDCAKEGGQTALQDPAFAKASAYLPATTNQIMVGNAGKIVDVIHNLIKQQMSGPENADELAELDAVMNVFKTLDIMAANTTSGEDGSRSKMALFLK